jgi:hypothetical protein
MEILTGWERSQIVLKEFLELGFDAVSCDTQPTYGDYPLFHIQRFILFLNIVFTSLRKSVIEYND